MEYAALEVIARLHARSVPTTLPAQPCGDRMFKIFHRIGSRYKPSLSVRETRAHHLSAANDMYYSAERALSTL